MLLYAYLIMVKSDTLIGFILHSVNLKKKNNNNNLHLPWQQEDFQGIVQEDISKYLNNCHSGFLIKGGGSSSDMFAFHCPNVKVLHKICEVCGRSSLFYIEWKKNAILSSQRLGLILFTWQWRCCSNSQYSTLRPLHRSGDLYGLSYT